MTTLRQIASSAALSFALALSLVLASSAAFAGEKGAGATFPVAGPEFQQKVTAKIEKHRAKMEAKLTEKNIPADKAAKIRARFAARSARVNAAVEKAVADGTVTKEEAKEVRAAGGGHKGHGKERGPKKALARRVAVEVTKAALLKRRGFVALPFIVAWGPPFVAAP